MSKTVELLLQRRKVAPQEFNRSFDRANIRWEFFFKRHRIDLDNPQTYPIGLRDEQLYAQVMERILTGDDDFSPLLSIAQITKHSLQILEDELALAHKANIADEFR